ncbi:hypothetical protein ACVWYQ_006612 [Bradyrhizobium sp. USDA 3397]
MAGRDLGRMILVRESFGKLPHIPKNGLVGPIQRYYGIRNLVSDNRRPRSHRALQLQRLMIKVLLLHSEQTGVSGIPKEDLASQNCVPQPNASWSELADRDMDLG